MWIFVSRKELQELKDRVGRLEARVQSVKVPSVQEQTAIAYRNWLNDNTHEPPAPDMKSPNFKVAPGAFKQTRQKTFAR